MLPYTPLHHVLLRDVGRPLVMTSGNLSEEPIAQNNDEARRRLGPLADAFLLHNRDIYARYDDSVVVLSASSMRTGQSLTRSASSPAPSAARGAMRPFPVRLPFQTGQILAVGAELKNTFCLTRDDFAFLSQHIGDMENLETLEHFEAVHRTLYKHLFRIEPELIAHDLHPDYFATRYAHAVPSARRPRIAVQHHQAHIAACLADNGWPPDDGPSSAWPGMAPATAWTATSGAASSSSATIAAFGGPPTWNTCPCPAATPPSATPGGWPWATSTP